MERTPPGNTIHFERAWRITLTPAQAIAYTGMVLTIAGGILRFEWFINHTEKYERWTRTEIIRIESKEGLQPAQEPEADSDPHSFPTLAKGTAGP